MSSDEIILTKEEASECVFCFLGEFGYEIVSWLPYLFSLKCELGVNLNTISRPGSTPLYWFSDMHAEADYSLVGEVWGRPDDYSAIQEKVSPRLLVYPGVDMRNERHISVEGHVWMNGDIHAPIDETNYCLLDFSAIVGEPPFVTDLPLIVVNNKYFQQWSYEEPINFFSREELAVLRDLLVGKGYAVAYNHFIELTLHPSAHHLDDRGIFGEEGSTFDMRAHYDTVEDYTERNLAQIRTYNKATMVIGPQGGNLYLPAACRCDLVVLLRDGDAFDYMELGRVYGTQVEVFRETDELLAWVGKLPPLGGDK